jgi:Raf kinase inhibitor-like YbhB/YbcL family protein
MKYISIGICLFIVVVVAMIYFFSYIKIEQDYEPKVNLKVSSDAFENDGIIPKRYTGRGEDISPSLKFETILPEAKTIAIIVDDPDTPIGTFTHWVVWNIPSNVSIISEGIQKGKILSSIGNARQGKNGYLINGYRGPKPPNVTGTHTYRFKVYVLNTELTLKSNAGKKQLLRAMKGNVIQYGILTGRFRSSHK